MALGLILFKTGPWWQTGRSLTEKFVADWKCQVSALPVRPSSSSLEERAPLHRPLRARTETQKQYRGWHFIVWAGVTSWVCLTLRGHKSKRFGDTVTLGGRRGFRKWENSVERYFCAIWVKWRPGSPFDLNHKGRWCFDSWTSSWH